LSSPATATHSSRSAAIRGRFQFGFISAIALAIGYFSYLFRAFRGKATPENYH
jgi:hypothetical protein